MKYQIVEKAWILNNCNLEEPYFHNTDIVYYGNRGQAKRQAVVDNALGKTLNGEEISFLNIKIKRFPNNDKIIYNGNIIKRYEQKSIERLNNIKELDKNKFYYVQDRRSYVGNAVLWWAKNGNGYVTDLSKAHKYSYVEIIKFNPRGTDIIWESEHVEKAIKQYVDMQYFDKNYSI